METEEKKEVYIVETPISPTHTRRYKILKWVVIIMAVVVLFFILAYMNGASIVNQ